MTCERCKKALSLMAIGVCKECGGYKSSISYKYCDPCSKKLSKCHHCGIELNGQTK